MAQRKTASRPRKRRVRKPQQQRATETRGAILREAETLFARDGFAGASLGALAEAVGIHKPGIFYYFPDKRALYEAVVGEALGSLEEALAAALASGRPARERILDAAAQSVKLLSSRPSIARLLLHEAANPEPARMPAVFSQVGLRIQAAMSEALREIHPEIDEDELHHYFSLITGTSLFYASAMQRFLAASDDAGLAHSMAIHRRLLLRSSQDFLDRLAA